MAAMRKWKLWKFDFIVIGFIIKGVKDNNKINQRAGMACLGPDTDNLLRFTKGTIHFERAIKNARWKIV
jgi:hypothetical protein